MQNEDLKKWVEIWQNTGLSLQKIRVKELKSRNYYKKNQNLLNEMLSYAMSNKIIRKCTGLVEQQHLFMKYRTRMSLNKSHEKE
jgi:hypothetical protein